MEIYNSQNLAGYPMKNQLKFIKQIENIKLKVFIKLLVTLLLLFIFLNI